MKNPVLGAAVLAFAACGGGKPPLLDAAVDAQMVCNPIAQTGCQAGEKCTWFVDINGSRTMLPIGHIGCSPVGPTPIANGEVCTPAMATPTGGSGVDSCIAGSLCISGRCKPICDPQILEGVAGGCMTNFSCTVYAGFFQSGGADAVAGVCESACDPLTQKLSAATTGPDDACGSAMPDMPTRTCVPGFGFRTFHCAPFDPTDPEWAGATDRKPPLTAPSGDPYGNGCAPGFIPGFFYKDSDAGAMTQVCMGLCKALKSDEMIHGMMGHETDHQGDPTALAKLPTQAAPLAGNAVCARGKKGADDVASALGQDCRFMWWPLAEGDPSKALQIPYNDTLGFCFAFEKFLITVPGMTEKQRLKSCAELPLTAPPTDPFGSAKENGCYPLSESRRADRRVPRGPLATWRFAYESTTLVRHVFD